jgi:Arc/MetJ family transcription regulator
MRTNLVLDDDLLDQVKRLSGAPTKRAAVEEAMRTYVEIKAGERRAASYAERARRLEARLRGVRLGESSRDLLRADRDRR